MKWTGLNELRESYLKFFESKDHLRMASAPLVPQGDNSVRHLSRSSSRVWRLPRERE